MKKLISISVLLILVLSFFTVGVVSAEKSGPAKGPKTEKVEVLYFHFTRRCVTCQAVEAESKKAIEALYPTQMKTGKITFASVNLDDKKSKALADRCKAEGQALLVINGAKRVDLTDQGFMYARSKPEKLKAELKRVVDAMLK